MDVYVKAKDISQNILNELPNQDLFTLEEIMNAFEEIIYLYHNLQEEKED